jgi:hypothetical protein
MRPRLLLSALFLVAIGCPRNAAGPHTMCDPGTEIFCRCKGGSPGTKMCGAEGTFFGECRMADGTCSEIAPVTEGDEPTPSGGGSCDHDACDTGAALSSSCDSCAATVCDSDPFCCDEAPGEQGSWDQQCVKEAKSACGMCGGGSPSASSGLSNEGMGGGPATTDGAGGAGGGGSIVTSSTSASAGSGPTLVDCTPASKLWVGDLVITEIMNDPKALTDAQGEWLEIYNASKKCVDLKGLVIQTNSGTHTIGSSVTVDTKAFAVLGRDKAALSMAGVELDYAYGTGVTLANTSDTVRIKAGILTVDYVTYDSINLKSEGASRTLDPAFSTANSNDSGIHWCLAKTFLDGMAGDRGTPGKANDLCK